MGMFDLFKKRTEKPQSNTSASQYEPFQNRASLKSESVQPDQAPDKDNVKPDNALLTDMNRTGKSSEEGLDDTENLSRSIASESQNSLKYKSAYENIIMDQRQRERPSGQNRPTRFLEKNNMGIRIRSMTEKDTQNLKIKPFEQEGRQQFEPYIRYLFASAEDARDALLGLDFIYEAEDTGNLICTEPLTFGCYRQQNGKHEAYIGGWHLTLPLWAAIKESFAAHNGQIKNEQRPNDEFGLKSERGMTLSERVTKLREYSQLNSGQTEFYSIYEAPNGVIAQAFLKLHQNMITKSDWYIVVKTPDGDFWRDIDGIYQK